MKNSLRRLISIVVLAGSLVYPHKLTAGQQDLELLGFEAEAVSDEELAEVRGGYGGVYFEFDFSGYWDHLSNVDGCAKADGALNYSGSLGDVNIQVNSSPQPISDGGTVTSQNTIGNGDQQVMMKAFVGDINQTQGAIQICQVPGSNNVVTTIMNLQFTVINISDPSKLGQLQGILSGVLGQ
ncbi:MAG: hypothetical protein V1736_09540 [Pseudomonadota bacterium]